MCEPTTLLALSVATSLGQSIAGYSAANAQYKQGMEMHRQNAENAALATADQYSNLNIRSQQEGLASYQQQEENQMQTAKAGSAVHVAAGEANVGGLAVGHVLRDLYMQSSRSDATADTNLRMSRDYLSGEMKSTERQGQGQINSVPIPQRPSMMPFALQAFGSSLDSYSQYKQRQG